MQLRTGLLIVQSVVATMSAVYFLLAMITFGNLRKIDSDAEACGMQGTYMNGVLVACFLSFGVSVLYIVFSIPILLNRCCRKSVEATFAWGVLMTATIYSTFFYLQAGFTINMVADKTNCLEQLPDWDQDNSNVLKATYIFAYILVGLYLVMFVIFSCSRRAFNPPPPALSNAPSSGHV
eukprot:TRINITY_DN6017_c0_g1_i6.p3 TRINITY_DN6017_c0_g1~~TRINITY_DN6017_c0_g1_i6.p3  ORF type:complete len:179 (-),score=1.69 TRINITY_DN6017_c0_g1_i6:752-1288(-)